VPWLKTRRHEHARTYPPRRPQSFWRIWALVQKVKIRRLGLSLHVADLAGIRNLKKMVEVEFRVVKWLQSIDQLPVIALSPSGAGLPSFQSEVGVW
jgi:hypothetical protein